MNQEIPSQSNPEDERPHLEGPIEISDAMDAIVSQLWDRHSFNITMDWALDTQAALYTAHRQKREQGSSLSPEDEAQLDEINNVLLNLQHLSERYNPEE